MNPHRTKGFVLLTVLVVTMLGSMIALSLLYRMRSEEFARTATVGAECAWAAAMSGVYTAMRVAAAAPEGSTAWWNEPGEFQQQLVTDDGVDQWYFSVFSPAAYGSSEVRYGLTDEASKINLNSPAASQIEKLPGLSQPLAQGLLDFVDTDSTTRPQGAEQPEYTILGRTYQVRNGPLATVGESLLVRGFSPSSLYGENTSLLARLGVPVAADSSLDSVGPGSQGTGDGLSPSVTVSSYDLNLDSQHRKRLNLNQRGQNLSGLDLPTNVVTFIQNLWTNQQTLASPADLLDAKLTIKTAKGGQTELDSGVGKDELPVLLDRTTTTNANRLVGLINVNTASARVLATVPGIDASLADSIVATRSGLDPESRQTIAWLFTQGVLNADQFKQAAPWLTARSFQFSFEVIGFGLPSGRYCVLEAIVDVATHPPAINYLRNLTALGLPFPLNPTGEQP